MVPLQRLNVSPKRLYERSVEAVSASTTTLRIRVVDRETLLLNRVFEVDTIQKQGTLILSMTTR